MILRPTHRLPAAFSLALLAFAAIHLGYEHFRGGVLSHNLLNRPDLPAISNWLGLIVLPLLGWALGTRVRNQLAASAERRLPVSVPVAVVGALLYGAAMAVSFALDATAVTSGLFFALFVLAPLLPVYRAEYFVGFVVGMTVTFGAVLPSLIGSIFATLSFVLRHAFRAIASAIRSRRLP